jgi:hypothetical protein
MQNYTTLHNENIRVYRGLQSDCIKIKVTDHRRSAKHLPGTINSGQGKSNEREHRLRKFIKQLHPRKTTAIIITIIIQFNSIRICLHANLTARWPITK